MITASRVTYARHPLFCLVIFFAFACCVPKSLLAQTQPTSQTPAPSKIDWQKGPFVAKLGTVAEIKVPQGYEFSDGEGARKYLEMTGNPPEGSEIGIVTPIGQAKEDDWVILFDFDETGYVKDDEKSSIDANKLLENMKKGTEEDNEERKKRGWMPFHLDGWTTQPFYDTSTNNLTWGTLGHNDKNLQTINYATRVLGRHGVVRVDLVTDPETVAATLPRFKSVMSGFSFTNGSRYSDFVSGDKVATYGLTALIAGGATAVAIKTGLFAKLLAMLAAMWKVIAVAFAALVSRLKNIITAIKNKFGKKSDHELSPDVRDDAS
jgi:uncharacterized membrane-anchored protein